jgi:amino acid transporter
VITAVIGLLTTTNIRGVRLTATVTNLLTIGKLIPLIGLVTAGAFYIRWERFSFAAPPEFSAFSYATSILAFAYMGFEGAAIPTGEIRNPARQLPFALLTGLAVVAAVYLGVQLVCVGTVNGLAQSERPLADAGRIVLGPLGAALISAGALISILGTLNALMFATPRILFAMAEQRQLPGRLRSAHVKLQTPVLAILLTATITLALALFSTFRSALTMSVVARLTAFASTCAALPALRRKRGGSSPAFVVPAGDLVAGTALVLICWLLASSNPAELRVVAVVLLLGAGVSWICRPSRLVRATPPIGRGGGSAMDDRSRL